MRTDLLDVSLVDVVAVEVDNGTWRVELLACGHRKEMHAACAGAPRRRRCNACEVAVALIPVPRGSDARARAWCEDLLAAAEAGTPKHEWATVEYCRQQLEKL